MSKATRRLSSDRPRGTSLEIVQECCRALRRAVEPSEKLVLGTDVVVAACPKSPRSKACRVQPDAWLIDTGSGHDLVDFALVPDSAQLIEPANSNIVPRTANSGCRPNGSIIMDIKPLKETSSALVLENTPNVLSVGLRCMGYGYSFHWPCGQVPCQRHTSSAMDLPFLPHKTRLEALSRPDEPPAGGCDAPASGGGLMITPPVGAKPLQAGLQSQILWS